MKHTKKQQPSILEQKSILFLMLMLGFSQIKSSEAAANALEDEMFGDSVPKPAATETKEETTDRLQTKGPLQEIVQKTNVGGRADWSLHTFAEKIERVSDLPIENSFAGLVYLDSRPSDIVRGYIKLRLFDGSFDVSEYWMKWQTETNGLIIVI